MLKGLIEDHLAETSSAQAGKILANWEACLDKFWQVVPKEIVALLEHPLTDTEQARDTA